MAVRFVVRSRDGQKLQAELAFPFDQARIVLGRGPAADVRIPDPAVSEAHASVQLRGSDWMLTDLASRNGTKHNGQRLLADRARKLRDGDLIELGTYTLSFHSGVLMTEPMSAERTAELARRLWREAQSARGIELPAPRLCVLSGPRTGDRLEIPPAPSRMHVGGGDKCQLVLPEPALARDTLEIAHDLEGVLMRSLSGEAIIQVGSQRFKSRRLRDGDEFQVGATRCLFEEPAQGAIDALKGEPELLLSAAALPERTVTTPAAPSEEAVERPSKRPAAPVKSGRSDADMVIYALAIAVLVASALGLALLLHVR
jgi:pSer/pThr/pTyr-binding forkhead associated (FHA) protein